MTKAKGDKNIIIQTYLSTIILIIRMNSKYTTKHTEQYASLQQPSSKQSSDLYWRPVKSPSPDKNSDNIIASTRSPQIDELKRFNYSPEKQATLLWNSQNKTKVQKPGYISTPSKLERDQYHPKKIDETRGATQSRYISNGVRSTKIEIIASNTPDVFQERQRKSRIGDVIRGESIQLDYLRLLKTKEETIKQLKDVISIIKLTKFSHDEQNDYNTSQLRQRIHELMEESKTLRVQNQHLLNIIQKLQNAAVNSKTDNSHKKVRQLEDIIREKDLAFEDKYRSYELKLVSFKDKQIRLQSQIQYLTILLKQREGNLENSALSAQNQPNEKQRASLAKIKEQQNQNLKIVKQDFQRQIKQLQVTIQYQLQQQQRKIDHLQFRLIYQVQNSRNNLLSRLDEYKQNLNLQQENHRQNLTFQQNINSMMEKISIYQKELIDLKGQNNNLVNQLSKANKANEQLQSKSQLYWQELSHLRLKPQDDETEQIVSERNILQDENNLLKQENNRLKILIEEINTTKNAKISQLQSKIQIIVDEYQRQIIQEQKKTQSQLKKVEELYQKDMLDTEDKFKITINLFNKQNQEYKKAVMQKNYEMAYLQKKLQNLSVEHSQCNISTANEQQYAKLQAQYSQFKTRYIKAQREIQKMSEELVQSHVYFKENNDYILKLQKNIDNLTEQKEKLSKQYTNSRINNDQLAIKLSKKEREAVDLQSRINKLQKELYQHQESYLSQLANLKNQNNSLQQKEGSLLFKLHQHQQQIKDLSAQINHQNAVLKELQRNHKEYVSFNNLDYMQQELRQLKRVVQQYLINNNSQNENQILEDFYNISYNYQARLEESIRFMKEIEQLRSQNAARNREKTLLEQKISMLQNNIIIYQRQINERRLLYDQLLQQKARVQKQVFISRKIKMEQSQRSNAYNSNAGEITSRIDHLLELQSKRKQNLKGLYFVRQT